MQKIIETLRKLFDYQHFANNKKLAACIERELIPLSEEALMSLSAAGDIKERDKTDDV